MGYQQTSQAEVGQLFDSTLNSQPQLFWAKEVWLIGQVVWLSNIRNKSLNLMRILQRVFIAAVMASLYSGIDLTRPGQTSVQDVNGRLYFAIPVPLTSKALFPGGTGIWCLRSNGKQCVSPFHSGLLFTFVTESTFNVIYGFLWEFPGSLAIARRDVSDGLYRSWTFYLAKHLAFWPLILPESVLITAVTFSTVTLNIGPSGVHEFQSC